MNLIPRDDQSEFEVSVITPEGYTLERTDRAHGRARRAAAQAARAPCTCSRRSARLAGGRTAKGQGDVTRGTIYVRMKDLEDRDYTPVRGAGPGTRDDARTIPTCASASTTSRPSRAGGGPRRSRSTWRAPTSRSWPSTPSRSSPNACKERGGLADLDTTLSLRKPEVQVAVDREAASDLGIPVGTIADTLRVLVGGSPSRTSRRASEQYDVWLRAEPSDRRRSQDLYAADASRRRRPDSSSSTASPS